MEQRNLTVTEAARRLGIHPNTLRRWVDAGVIEAVVLPSSGFRRFKPSVVEAMKREMESGSLAGKNAA